MAISIEEIERLKRENKAFKNYFISLSNGILKEIEKDGWCRLIVSKEDALKMKEFVDHLEQEEKEWIVPIDWINPEEE